MGLQLFKSETEKMPSAWQIHDATPSSRESLSILKYLVLNEDIPKPTNVGSGEVLLRIRAASINSRDLMILAHDPLYPGAHKQDLIPCSDAAGEVEAVGSGSVWKAGDRVLLHQNSWLEGFEAVTMLGLGQRGGGDIDGTLRQYVVAVGYLRKLDWKVGALTTMLYRKTMNSIEHQVT